MDKVSIRWYIKTFHRLDTDKIEKYLSFGWEPFAANDRYIFLRKKHGDWLMDMEHDGTES